MKKRLRRGHRRLILPPSRQNGLAARGGITGTPAPYGRHSPVINTL